MSGMQCPNCGYRATDGSTGGNDGGKGYKGCLITLGAVCVISACPVILTTIAAVAKRHNPAYAQTPPPLVVILAYGISILLLVGAGVYFRRARESRVTTYWECRNCGYRWGQHTLQ